MLWLVLLGVAVALGIALRRVLRRQAPLNDELYSKTVAVDHVQSGVAWVRGDGTYGLVNPSFAKTFQLEPRDFIGREWYKVFTPGEQARIRDSYSQMMLMGVIAFEASGERADRKTVCLDVRMVAVHDHHMRFVGHHCMIEDKTRERELEQTIRTLQECEATTSLGALDRAAGRSVSDAISHALNSKKASAPQTRSPLTRAN
jgi:PAS domain-containing protein